MDERKKRVLSAIINDYIANAEPVGSRTITKKYDLGVSPATIRNEMSDLEDEGYIEQPHTSAGRIPSAKGYRYYVDHLMRRERLSAAQLRQIREFMASGLSEMDHFMRACCNMISRMTNYTAIAAIPERSSGRIVNLQLLPVNERQVLTILLTSSGLVRYKLLDLPSLAESRELPLLEQRLQQALVGSELSAVSTERLHELIQELQLRERMQEQVIGLLEQTLAPEESRRVFTGGVMNMLSQPEFRDIDKLKGLFSLLDEDGRVKELLAKASPEDSVLTVTIGGEIPVEGVQDCSLVVANYFVDGERAGSIGVLGPTRMSYGRTVSLMEQIAAELSRTMSGKEK